MTVSYAQLVIATCAAAPFLLCGCGGETEPAGLAGRIEPSACAGRITTEPVVLSSELPGGRLMVGGDHLILFGDDGVVSRLDRCSGAAQPLASGVISYSSVFTADYVWFSSASPPQSGLFRILVSGGAVEQVVADVPTYTRLRAHDTTLYFVSGSASDSVNRSAWSVYGLEASQTEPTPLATLSAPLGQSLTLSGVSDAGLYLTSEYDCMCTSPVRRLPFGATDLVTVQGGEGKSGSYGAYSMAVAGERLYLRLSNGGAPGQITRLPLAGGESEIIVPAGLPGEGLLHFAANDRAVCWMVYQTGLEVTAHCVDPRHPSRAVREIDRFESGAGTSLALASDAAYWLRRSRTNSGFYELVAQAL